MVTLASTDAAGGFGVPGSPTATRLAQRIKYLQSLASRPGWMADTIRAMFRPLPSRSKNGTRAVLFAHSSAFRLNFLLVSRGLLSGAFTGSSRFWRYRPGLTKE